MNFNIKLSIFFLLIAALIPATPIKNNLQTLLRPPSSIKSKGQIETPGLRIDAGFPGRNVVIENESNDTVYFKPDLTPSITGRSLRRMRLADLART